MRFMQNTTSFDPSGSDPDPSGCFNNWTLFQVKELVKFVKKSDADFLVLGGDFNVDPNVSS